MTRINRTDVVWYALRVTYSREMIVKEHLDTEGIENFIPMHYEIMSYKEKKVRKLVPIIHNLIFVRTSREKIDQIKREKESLFPIRYIMDRETQEPIVVPDSQMKNFISVAGTYDEQIIYLDIETINCKKGDTVRILGGPFVGVEGTFIRIKGDRRVVVSISGLMAVATTFIHPSLIEVIK